MHKNFEFELDVDFLHKMNSSSLTYKKTYQPTARPMFFIHNPIRLAAYFVKRHNYHANGPVTYYAGLRRPEQQQNLLSWWYAHKRAPGSEFLGKRSSGPTGHELQELDKRVPGSEFLGK